MSIQLYITNFWDEIKKYISIYKLGKDNLTNKLQLVKMNRKVITFLFIDIFLQRYTQQSL